MVRYKIRVAGKVFESENTQILIKHAVEAKRAALKQVIRPDELRQPISPIGMPIHRSAC